MNDKQLLGSNSDLVSRANARKPVRDSIRVRVPATTANIGPGFDVFALALKEPYDVMEIEKRGSGVIIKSEGYRVPREPEKNCAGFVALEMLRKFGIREGVRIKIKKNIKPASGLGSSAASGAGVAFGLNELFNLNLTKEEIIEYASHGEIVSAGFPHCDNVVACIFGGFTITISYNPLEVVSFEPPEDFGIVIALPDVDKGSTEFARSVVPKLVPIKKLVYNIGHASLLSAGMALKNIDLIKRAMSDCIVEPARAKAGILKEFFEIKKLGKDLNAGIAASGAGPAILGIVEREKRMELADAMKRFFVERGYECETYITEPGEGTTILGE